MTNYKRIIAVLNMGTALSITLQAADFSESYLDNPSKAHRFFGGANTQVYLTPIEPAIVGAERFSRYNENKKQLSEKLESSAFRRGVSVGMRGMMKIAPSDHLPITITFRKNISIASWNLLSDQFIWNYFREFGEKPYFEIKRDDKALDWKTVFKDLTGFLFKNSVRDQKGIYQIKFTAKLMEDFLAERRENLENLKADEKTKTRAENALRDEEAFISLILDRDHPHHEDMKISLIHALEIRYAIDSGYLRWEKRFEKLAENKSLASGLAQHDFFTFQEATEPQDMLDLIRKYNRKEFGMLVHRVENQSKDHCVIIYDRNKYALEGSPKTFGLAKNTKPSMIAKFRSIIDGKPIIIGSIHHAGRGKSEMKDILEQIQLLKGSEDVPVLIAGDYNHQSAFYQNDLTGTGFNLIMPNAPTMAGFEYGNLNKAIDGVLTNRATEVNVGVLPQNVFASQVELPIIVEFEF